MPLGIVIIMVATIFLLAGHGQELCFTLFLSRKWTLALFFALILSYMVSPYTFEGVSIFWVPYLLLLSFSVYLLINLSHPLRSIFCSAFTAFCIFMLSLFISPQPKGYIYEPFVIYSLVCSLLSIIFAYSRSSAIFNSIVSILVFNSILIFRGGYSTLLAPSAFTAACLSCCISVVPILLSQKITVFRTRRIFQTEAGSSLHPLTGKKRKRFKK